MSKTLNCKVFDKGDDEYFDWMDDYPQGFILNVGRSLGVSSVRVHRSRCTHIGRGPGMDEGAFTKRTQIKIAALEVDELVRWRNLNRPAAEIQYCPTCNAPKSTLDEYHPDELDSQTGLWEGIKTQVVVNWYERSIQARQRCIAHYGTRCLVCELDFVERYGPIGEGFIHVHHIKPLASINAGYQVDPINDLRPVCPNCHAMLHRGKEQPLTIEELRIMLNR